MRHGQLNTVLLHIRSTVAARQTRELPDQELLERFVADHDEVAFTAILERHGGLVLGVCRRILRNEHDAEDACQATFLVLTRKAGTIRKGNSLASWLYGVAGRIARKLRTDAQRRSSHDVSAAEVAAPDTTTEITWREGLAVLDEELSRLPASYRSALILCYLAGRRQDEAARELGCSLGVLCGRLVRAREWLRKRLLRRGVVLPLALVGTVLAATAAGAALPASLAVKTVKAATALLSGQTLAHIVPSKIAAITEGALTSMFVNRVKTVAALLLVSAGLMIAGAGAFRAAPPVQKEPPSNEAVSSTAVRAPDVKEPNPKADNKRGPDEKTIRCVVRDKAGKPIAGAHVYWTSAATVAPVTSPKALPRAQWGYIKKVVAEGKTDAEGRCELRGRPTGQEYRDSWALATLAPGYGLSGKPRFDLPGKGADDD